MEVIGGIALAVVPGVIVALITLYLAKRTESRSWSEWKGGIGEFKTHVETTFREIKDSIDKIRESISSINSRLAHLSGLVGHNSPISLTDKGREVSAELEGSEWAIKEASRLADRIEGKNEYEIQEFCFEYVREDFTPDNELNKKLQECAYRRGATVDDLKEVLAVELRDAMLKRLGLDPPE